MDKFFMGAEDFKKTKVTMGNKKKEIDVKQLVAQSDFERQKRKLEKLQLESATTIQSYLRRYRTNKMLADTIFGAGHKID